MWVAVILCQEKMFTMLMKVYVIVTFFFFKKSLLKGYQKQADAIYTAFYEVIIISSYGRGDSGEMKIISLTSASSFVMQGCVKAVD